MKKIFCQTVLAFIVVFAIGSVAQADTTNAQRLATVNKNIQTGERPVRIVAFGDSITGVYYHTGCSRAWADMLELALKKPYPNAQIEMTNAGISGHTSAQGLARIEKDVIAKKPDLVVVMFGMNDCSRAPLEEFRKNMEKIAERCFDAGSAVVFSTPNTVYQNPHRPIAWLAEFARAAREVARKLEIPMADSFSAYARMEREDPNGWRLLMSETIHPNLNGHRKFAEVMSKAITGQAVSLDDFVPLENRLPVTFAALESGKPVKIVAMQPYDQIVENLLKRRYSNAQIETVSWPTEGKSLGEIEAWGAKVRKLNPTLVVMAIPSSAEMDNDEDFLRTYEWTICLSLHFSHRRWDLLPILPNVAGEVPEKAKKHHDTFVRSIFKGIDYQPLDRKTGDQRTAEQIVDQFLDSCK
jgi:lysophospholipase L1-like esterase